jgi:hypothetical protein
VLSNSEGPEQRGSTVAGGLFFAAKHPENAAYQGKHLVFSRKHMNRGQLVHPLFYRAGKTV